MNRYHCDFESFSECDIKLGAFRYASDPSTKILWSALAVNDDPPTMWDSRERASKEAVPSIAHPFYGLLDQMIGDSESLIYAHNSQFEAAICKYLLKSTFGYESPDLKRWRCTASMCRRAAIPHSLQGASNFMGLKAKKMTAGKTLINLFSVPHVFPKSGVVTVDGVKMTVDEAWKLFGEYCRQDVEAERELHARLRAFELKGTTLESFQFDLRMNEYGIPVNVDALTKAQKIVDDVNGVIGQQFFKLTGLKISQTAAITTKLQGWGYPCDDLQAATLDTFFESEPGPQEHDSLRPALKLRQDFGYAAVKKIPTMLAAACSDGRVRGGFMWSGAIRTHRWAGRIIQPQNFKRPVFKDTASAYQMIKDGCSYEDLGVLWGSPLEVLASSIRHFIEDSGHDLIDADFASIEMRVAPWLAGQDDMVEEFRRGEKLYENMAAAIFDVLVEEVNTDQRFTGKIACLSAVFGVSWRRFQAACKMYGRDLPDKVCQLAIFKYRKKCHMIVQMWKDLQSNAVKAINNPGERQFVNEKISLVFGRIGGFPALTIHLPSGHMLVYPEPSIRVVEIVADVVEEDERGELIVVQKRFNAEQISFYGPLPLSTQWGQVTTYGSKFFENCVQAVAGDFMVHALLEVERRGFKPFATIHDQVLAPFEHTPGQDGQAILECFKRVFCSLPKWATDFPLDASVKVTPFYQKD